MTGVIYFKFNELQSLIKWVLLMPSLICKIDHNKSLYIWLQFNILNFCLCLKSEDSFQDLILCVTFNSKICWYLDFLKQYPNSHVLEFQPLVDLMLSIPKTLLNPASSTC